VVVGSSKDAQVVAGGDSSRVLRSSISDGGAVAGDGSLLDIVTSSGTSEEAILTNDCVNVGSWALEEIEEGAAVEVGLHEVDVEFGALGLGSWEEGAENLSLEALGDHILELNLGVESVDGVPGLSER